MDASRKAKARQAKDFFNQGYNCAQAVAAPFAQEMGLPLDTVVALASGFGGGMAGMRQMCGAVSGMFLVMGQLQGRYSPDDPEAKKAHYAKLRAMAEHMEQRYGSLICGELLKLNDIAVQADPSVRDDEYYAKRPCGRYVEACAGILEEELG